LAITAANGAIRGGGRAAEHERAEMRRARHFWAAILVLLPLTAHASLDEARDAYAHGDQRKAFGLVQTEADRGDAEAQMWLGTFFVRGEGVPRDFGRGIEWLTRSAEQGHVPAQVFLGRLYTEKQPILRNPQRAYMWFNVALSFAKGAGVRNTIFGYRQEIEAEMTPAEIERAQRAAEDWLKKNMEKK
jgi:TPR repeat protein